MQIQLTGTEAFFAALAEVREAGEETVVDFVTIATMSLHRRAVRSIQRGPASGRIYQKYNPRRTHQASAPGEAPMSDQGRLVGSIQFELPSAGDKTPEGVVGTNLDYGKFLELKPSTRGGRPWLKPAFDRTAADAQRLLTSTYKAQARKRK